jgi:hypothetical protein
MPGLALGDREAIPCPGDVVQGERRDLPRAKAVGDKQEQDRVVAPPARRPAVDGSEHAPDVIPGDRPRDAREPVDLRPRHCLCEIALQEPSRCE